MASSIPATKLVTVAELIKENAAAIAQLKQANASFANRDIGMQFDELFVLRYLLSAKGDVKVAGKKLAQTLQWRVDNLERLNKAAQGIIPHKELCDKYVMSAEFGWMNYDFLFVIRIGLGDCIGLMEVLAEDDLANFFLMNNEMKYRKIDAKTREAGVLCKTITVVDNQGFSMSRFSRKFLNVISRNSHESNVYYPQSVRYNVFMNLPSTLRYILTTFRMLLPKSTMEKQRICPGKPANGQSAADCPFLKSQIGSDNAVKFVPGFMGGKAPLQERLRHASDPK